MQTQHSQYLQHRSWLLTCSEADFQLGEGIVDWAAEYLSNLRFSVSSEAAGRRTGGRGEENPSLDGKVQWWVRFLAGSWVLTVQLMSQKLRTQGEAGKAKHRPERKQRDATCYHHWQLSDWQRRGDDTGFKCNLLIAADAPQVKEITWATPQGGPRGTVCKETNPTLAQIMTD